MSHSVLLLKQVHLKRRSPYRKLKLEPSQTPCPIGCVLSSREGLGEDSASGWHCCPEGTKLATSENVKLLRLRKDLSRFCETLWFFIRALQAQKWHVFSKWHVWCRLDCWRRERQARWRTWHSLQRWATCRGHERASLIASARVHPLPPLHIWESRILAPVRPSMRAAGLQCLLRLRFPTPKFAHLLVHICPELFVLFRREHIPIYDAGAFNVNNELWSSMYIPNSTN